MDEFFVQRVCARRWPTAAGSTRHPCTFLYTDGERFLAGAGAGDVKSRNVERTAQAALCVEKTEGNARSFVSVSGPATVRRQPDAADLRAFDEHYAPR